MNKFISGTFRKSTMEVHHLLTNSNFSISRFSKQKVNFFKLLDARKRKEINRDLILKSTLSIWYYLDYRMLDGIRNAIYHRCIGIIGRYVRISDTNCQKMSRLFPSSSIIFILFVLLSLFIIFIYDVISNIIPLIL